jgi:hypothetical protein
LSIIEDSIKSPASECQTSLLSEETIKSPEVIKEDPISDEEEKESGVEEIAPAPFDAAREIKPEPVFEEAAKEEEIKVEPVVSEQEEKEEDLAIEEAKVEKKEEADDEEDEFRDAEESATTATAAATEELPIVTEVEPKEEDEEAKDAQDEEEEVEKKKEEATEEVPVDVEEEKNEFDIIPTGPKLTTPVRARIGGGRARRSPQVVSQEPSQTELLQKELLEQEEEPSVAAEEEEKKSTAAPSPPAKPVKPIFAKFPTPFAAGADAISKTHLKPTQTRRLWDEKPADSASSTTTSNTEEEPQPVRPSGVKNIASRFNFTGNTGGGSNEVLETKLKNHTKNEVEKVRKEFEQLLNEEREKRLALENTVQELLEKFKALEQQ